MEKFKVNVDRPKPTSDEILSRRNFDELLKQYNAAPGKVVQKPFWKTGWFAGALATAAAVTIAIVVLNNRNEVNPDRPNQNQFANGANTRNPDTSGTGGSFLQQEKRRISPPVKGLDIAFASYQLNAARGGMIEHPSGSRIIVPANAFVDASGNAIAGNVNIQYREFRDQVDFFLSGIPMQYDSAGTTYQFESAGMMQIAAFVDGKVVFLKKDKPVEVQFASAKSGAQYSVYEFDTAAGNWAYHGKDKIEPKADAGNKTKNAPQQLSPEEQHIVSRLQSERDKEIATVKRTMTAPEEPAKPLKANHKKNRFRVEFSKHEFPEMASYGDVLWEVDENRTPFDRDYMYKGEWESVVVAKGTAKGKYVLTFSRGKEIISYDAYPVFDGKKYDEAITIFDQKFEEYSNAVARREEAIKTSQKRYEENLAKAGLAPDLSRLNQDANGKELSLLAQVMRVFTISNFGIYNCDHPESFPQGASVDVSLWDENGNQIDEPSYLHMADRNRAALFGFPNTPLATVRYNPESSNLLWMVRKDGSLAFADDDQFKQLPKSGKGQITLKTVNQKFKTPEEMKTFFRITPNII